MAMMRIGLILNGHPEHAVSRLRMTGPYGRLAGRNCAQVGVHPDLSLTVWDETENLDAVVIQRNIQPALAALLRLRCDKTRAALVWDVDDCLWNVPPGHPAAALYAPHAEHYRRLARAADLVTVATRANADAFGSSATTCVVPNILPVDIVMAADMPAEVASLTKADHHIPAESRADIGFAGSASHAPDFEFLIPVLLDLMRDHPAAQWAFHGYCPAELRGRPNVSHFPENPAGMWLDYHKNWSRRPFRIGLAPLVDNEFNRFKSGVKFDEYAARGAVGVYSDIAPFREAVVDGATGYLLPNDPISWKDCLSRLLAVGGPPAPFMQKVADALRRRCEIDGPESDGRLAATLAYVCECAQASKPSSAETDALECAIGSGRPVGVYGSGRMGRIIRDLVADRLKRRVLFVSSRPEPGEISPERAAKETAFVLIASMTHYSDMAAALERAGLKRFENYL